MSKNTVTHSRIALGVITASSLVASAGIVNSWDSPVNGNWNLASNWSLNFVPGDLDDAILGHTSGYAVTFTASNSVGNLDIANPNTQLYINDTSTLTINGTLLNNGLIVVNANSGNSATSLLFAADGLLDGTGTVRLNRDGSSSRIQTGAGVTVTQSASHTIDGSGQIRAAMINNGVISSNFPSGEMRLITYPKTNNLTMEAVNGARLDITEVTITQGVNGVIHSEGLGSEVELSSATIVGGSLTASVDAGTTAASSSILDSVYKSGDLNLANGQTLTIRNSFINEGLLTVNSNSGESDTTLFFDDSMILEGPGTIFLNQTGSKARIQTDAGALLTLPENQSIKGGGQIDAQFVNSGLIQTNDTLSEMRLSSYPKVNFSVIEAVNGARLDFNGVLISQFAPGVIRADGIDSQIKLNSATINGGDLETKNGAEIIVDGSSTINGVSLLGDLIVQNGQTLWVSSALENNGMIKVNSTVGDSAATLVFNHSMTLTGTGSILLNRWAGIQTLPGATLTIPATQSIFGEGLISGNLVNNGLIQSDVDGGEMKLTENPKTNYASIEATNNSRIKINGIILNQGPDGVIRADGDSSQLELTNTTIVGGKIELINGADALINYDSTFDGVSASGEININNLRTLSLSDTFTNNGQLNLNATGFGHASLILFNSMEIHGAGVINLKGGAQILGSPGVVLTLPEGQQIVGSGRILMSLVNNSLVQSNIPGRTLNLELGPISNKTTIEAVDGGNLFFDKVDIHQGPDGVLRTEGGSSRISLNLCTVNGGSLIASDGTIIFTAANNTLDGVRIAGTFHQRDGHNLFLKTRLTNDGLIVVNSDAGSSRTTLRLFDPMVIDGVGTIRLNSPSVASKILGSTLGLGIGQRLEGIGLVSVHLDNYGTIAPGLGVGALLVNQSIKLWPSSRLEVEINEDSGDLLSSSSPVELQGVLDVSFVDDFAPTRYWARTIITGTEITGEFDVVNMPSPQPGFVTRVHYTDTEVQIGHACELDLNLDGVLDFLDVYQFITDFGNMLPSADINNDGSFNFLDVSAFLQDFGINCSY